jgi:hypothetical protein
VALCSRKVDSFMEKKKQTACGNKLFSITGEVTIEDKPRFAWRGLMLDTARNYISIDAIKRVSLYFPLLKGCVTDTTNDDGRR